VVFSDLVQTVFGWLAILVGLVLGPCPAQQQPKNVKVTLVVILASEHPVHVDPILVNVAKEVQKKKPELKCFKTKCMSCQSLEVNKKYDFKLVDKQVAEVTIKQPADKNKKVVLIVKPPMGGEIEYETVCAKFLPIVTRYETKKGERLILAIQVEPCSGGK
jgi:hypothetical protein